MRYRQGFPWVPFLIGLLLGAAAGLYYAWVMNPVTLVNIAPHQLTEQDREAYILLVGESYLLDRDLDRARARLDLLRDRDIAQTVAVQADSAFLRGARPEEVRALTALAEALGAVPLAADVFSSTIVAQMPAQQTPGTPTATFEAIPTPTPPAGFDSEPTPLAPLPTPTSLLDSGTTFELVSRDVQCPDSSTAGLLQVIVNDWGGGGIPGVEVLVQWQGGEDRFFTGLKPEYGSGYADLQMAPDRLYIVTLVGLSDPVLGIDSTACVSASGRVTIPTYRLVFGPAD